MTEIVSLMKKLNLKDSAIESMLKKIDSLCPDSNNFSVSRYSMSGNGDSFIGGNG